MNRSMLDLEDTNAIANAVTNGHDGNPWGAVVNGAAYTAVDRAESEQVDAWKINALAPAAFAQVCADAGVPMIQLSTDYVFSGTSANAWNVNDPVDPLNVYGASKLGGELAVRSSGSRYAIIRTAWIVSAHGSNFVKTMLRLATEHSRIRVVGDQIGSPTSAADLAAAVQTIAVAMAEDDAIHSGTFHFSNKGATNWAAFAEEIFRQSRLRGGPAAEVETITSADYPTAAVRPTNSLLNHDAIEAEYGIIPRSWAEAISDILDELIGMPNNKEIF
tara:strand:- start:131304 stop:132128 length:825 start_codon:yes stop_codon:yes gene_type:complete